MASQLELHYDDEFNSRSLLSVPRPFLKWAGGKGQLLPDLLNHVQKTMPFNGYHEPFVGGGALFFELARLQRLDKHPTCLSDTNPRLIETYQAVRDDCERLIELLHAYKLGHDEKQYYAVREFVPSGDVTARAARIIYLNKTCYNGLYRENSRGEFNVPFGRYKNPKICDPENLQAVSEALKTAKIECRPFETVLDHAKPGDFVYFDPPYHPLSKTASFTQYAKGGFNETAQRRLADVFAELDRRNVKVLLSNSMTPLVQELYAQFHIDTVYATRAVNSRADRRGPVPEALVHNF